MTRTLTYQPALDGVRALAVTLVLLFHHGFSWMGGGYVGVSVFFTLSGYLITSLLVTEHAATGRISLGGFYTRRARRLLPAALLCLAAVVIARSAGAFEGVRHLRRDLLGSLFQVQNWVKLVSDETYTDLLDESVGVRSPLEHFWSLAIEEQFYWLWPLAVLGLFAIARTVRARRAVITALALAGIVAGPTVAAGWGADAAYWATPARIGEILVGAAVAVWQFRVGAVLRNVLGAGALGAIVTSAVVWPSGSGPAYDGYLPLFALASGALIVSLQGGSIWRTALTTPPLVALGRISYGVYLFHWPVYLVLDADAVGADGVALFALRAAVTLAIATLSFVAVERPVRNLRISGSHAFARQGVAAALGAVVVGLATVVAVPSSGADYYVPDAATAQDVALQPVESLAPLVPLATAPPRQPADAPPSASTSPATTTADAARPASPAPLGTAATTTTVAPSTSTTFAVPPRPVRILVVGDSTALATGTGLIEWAALHPQLAQVSLATSPGCGFVRGSRIAEDLPFQDGCDYVLDVQLPERLTTLHPDVVVLMVTMRDVEDRTWTDDEGVLTPFDPRYRERLLQSYRTMATSLEAAGVPDVVWVQAPLPVAPFLPERQDMAEPARYDVQRAVVEQIAREKPGLVTVADLHAWMDARGQIRDGERRPDGVHLTPEAALEVSEEFLGPAIVAAALDPGAASMPPRPVRVLLVGDSTAIALGAGLVEWAAERPEVALVSISATPGCGVLRGGELGFAVAFAEACEHLYGEEVPAVVESLQPDVVVVFSTLLDVDDRQWSDAEGRLTPFDSRFRERLVAAYDGLAADLAARGVPDVVWIVPAVPNEGTVSEQWRDPARHAVVRAVIEDVATARPALVSVVDLPAWLHASGLTTDVALRPDGLHLSRDGARRVSAELVGPAVLAAALS